jgi:hypothetical protein
MVWKAFDDEDEAAPREEHDGECRGNRDEREVIQRPHGHRLLN